MLDGCCTQAGEECEGIESNVAGTVGMSEWELGQAAGCVRFVLS